MGIVTTKITLLNIGKLIVRPIREREEEVVSEMVEQSKNEYGRRGPRRAAFRLSHTSRPLASIGCMAFVNLAMLLM